MRRVGQLLSETRARVLPAGVDPALVVRFELDKGADLREVVQRLDEAGLLVVSIDGDKRAIVAFRADDDLRRFDHAMSAFERGPKKWEVLRYINPNTVRRWGRDDRIGPRLRLTGDVVRFEPDQTYKLDVEMWHPGTLEGARAVFGKVRRFLEARRGAGAKVLDQFVGTTLCLARVVLLGRDVDLLLEIAEIAEVDLPPLLQVDRTARTAGLATPFPTPAKPPDNGPRLCVLDSGVTSAHPLLGPFVGDASSVHSAITSAADIEGHGTAVASVAVFGDLRSHVAAGHFSSSITLFSARMLDDAAQLDEDKLVVNQIRAAVERYHAAPHNCRVFNLSFGERETFIEKSHGRQGIWAEALDLIAAEFDVVFVVSAGNVRVDTINTDEAEALVVSRGRHLREPRHRLVDPATAALAVTVGAVSERVTTTTQPGLGANDIQYPVAPNPGDPAPFTRVGPGVSGALKPDFVDDGGNMVWRGSMGSRQVGQDDANAVLVCAHQWRRDLAWFKYDIGTSLAAPRVARVAALVEHNLTGLLGRPPTANLIRAVLGAGASAAGGDLDGHCGKGATVNFTGYGRVDEDFALYSSDRRVVLFSEEEIPLDHFMLFEVPVPDEFVALRGKKHLTAAVAYDPPTRARRADYLGVGLDFHMYRGIDETTLFENLRWRRQNEGRQPDIPAKAQLELSPVGGVNAEFKWSRNASTLQVGRFTFERRPDANKWWFVVRVRRRWAPPEYERQRFALAIVLQASEGDFYARVQAQLRARTRARVRV